MGDRRDGDPPRLVADPANLRATLGWETRYADLRTIVEHAWEFASKRG
jgi:UDP-glucose 4-epimerase